MDPIQCSFRRAKVPRRQEDTGQASPRRSKPRKRHGCECPATTGQSQETSCYSFGRLEKYSNANRIQGQVPHAPRNPGSKKGQLVRQGRSMAISISTRIFVALTGSVKSIFLSVGKTPETSRIRMSAGLTRREMVGKGERMRMRTPARLTPSRVDFFTLLQKKVHASNQFLQCFSRIRCLSRIGPTSAFRAEDRRHHEVSRNHDVTPYLNVIRHPNVIAVGRIFL